MGIDHTEITKNRREVTISDGKEKVEIVTENVEVISVAAAELRKVEEVAAAQAQAISGRRGEEPASAQEEPGTAAEEETAPQPDEETAFEPENTSDAAEREVSAEAEDIFEEVELASAAEAIQEAEAALEAEAIQETETALVTEAMQEAEIALATEAALVTVAAQEAETALAAEAIQEAESAPETEPNQETEAATTAKPLGYEKDATVHVIGVRFKNAGKVFYFNPRDLVVRHGTHVIVETVRGIEYGTVAGFPMNIKASKLTQPLKDVIRIATPEDDETERSNRAKEKEAYRICQEKIRQHGLEMKLINAEYTFDNSKVLFYFRDQNIGRLRHLRQTSVLPHMDE